MRHLHRIGAVLIRVATGYQAVPATMVCLLSLPSVAGSQVAEVTGIRFHDSAHIAVEDEGMTETSGLAFSEDGKHLWTVSDNVGRVFLLGLDGDLKPSHSIEIGSSGLEGIAEDGGRERLLAVREERMEIVEVSLRDHKAQAFPLQEMSGFDTVAAAFANSSPNDGLEGITVDPGSGMVFVLKEKAPRMLIGISPDLTRIESALVLSSDLGFVSPSAEDADLDVAGLDFDPVRKAFWIVSDTGEAVYLFDPTKPPAKAWSLLHGDNPVHNAEGIALVQGGSQLAIVTDDGKDSRLLTYGIE